MCCGQKRQALKWNNPQTNETQEAEEQVHAPRLNEDAIGVSFKYTGNTMLEVNGFFNRRKYRFSTQTPVLIVSYDDVPGMRGYDELTEIK